MNELKVTCASPGKTPPYDEDDASGEVWGIRSPGVLWQEAEKIPEEEKYGWMAGCKRYVRKGNENA